MFERFRRVIDKSARGEGAPPSPEELTAEALAGAAAAAAAATAGGPEASPRGQPPQSHPQASGLGLRTEAQVAAAWARIETVRLEPKHLARQRIICFDRRHPAHMAFDQLRTRMLQVLDRQRLVRVGVTSPTKGCGKTFVTANLAFSLARQPSRRTVALDCDLRLPALVKALGVPGRRDIQAMFAGEVAPEAHLLRPRANLAVGVNTQPSLDAAELLQDPMTGAVLDRIQAELAPDVMLVDLPPMLLSDDVIGILPRLDALILVVGGGITLPEEIDRCSRLMGAFGPFLGVVMNRAEDAHQVPYGAYAR